MAGAFISRREDLEALARKYRRLAALRAQRDSGRGGGGDELSARTLRPTLRELAREFPGSLRELDTLGLAELNRRATVLTAVTAAAEGAGDREPWIDWINGYHAVMRAALHVKSKVGESKEPPLPAAQALTLAGEASQIAGVALDAFFVRAVANPPEGRIGIVVLRALGALFDERPDNIARALFPLRRPSPYNL